MSALAILRPASAPVPALYRVAPFTKWQAVELLGRHPSSRALIVREAWKFWPGIWLAWPEQVRLAPAEATP